MFLCAMKALLKIILQDEQEVFLFSNYETESTLEIKLLSVNCNESYIGFANELDLRAQAASIRLTFSVYISKLRNALFSNKPNGESYVYSLEKRDDKHYFSWKSVDSEETIIRLGSVPLEKKDSTTICKDVLVSVSQELLSSNQSILNLKTKLEASESKKTELMRLLSVATDAKQYLEKEMYSKFILVLNAKKRKLRELELKNKDDLGDSTNFQVGKGGRVEKHRRNMISESSDEADEDIDDIKVPGPSNSTKNLFAYEKESILPVTPNKIRNRKTFAVNKCTKSTEFKQKALSPKPDTTNSESDEDLFKHF